MKKIDSYKVVLALALIICLNMNTAVAFNVQPYANSEFIYATVTLDNGKIANFNCATYLRKDSIKVTSCWLQKKVDDKWTTISSLAAPSQVATKAYTYVVSKDYSDDIGSGTFRIGFIVDADGYSITRYSNEITY